MSVARGKLDRAQRRQIAWITLAAIVVFAALRWLPTGTNLSHMDFRVDAKGANAIEFCDPLNPQFIPVVAVKSPVVMTIETRQASNPPGGPGEVHALMRLATATGKPLAPIDLLEVHTRKLHLLIVDPTLTDYRHVHPEPGARAGEWTFSFSPRYGATYRVFADFTPAATGRGLYASADVHVAGMADMAGSPQARGAAPERPELNWAHDTGAYRFLLRPAAEPVRAGQPIDLKFSVAEKSGARVPLEPVMGAFAHLVAFDEKRSGFAHLHPTETDLARRPDALRPELNFKLTIPQPGRYVIWAQVNLGGDEEFVPFWIEVR